MNRYKKYKDSGIEWIGQIPFQWEKLKIGRSFSRIGSGTTPNTSNDEYYEGGEVNWLNTGDLNDSYITSTSKKITKLALEEISTLKLFPINSIVIALYGATIGKLGHLKIETTTNQACCVLTESKFIESRYLFYFLLGARDFIISKAYGGGQPNISQDLIKQLYIITPSKMEQIQIVKFLDHQTAVIDKLICKKEKLIEKLKEKRQAIINEAVTKGLDPNAKMMDSGIEWLGKIPENWEIVKLKFFATTKFSSVDRHEYDEENKVQVCHYPQAYKNEKINSETELSVGTCTNKELENFALRKGQVIITKDSETADDIGVASFVEEDIQNAVCGYHLAMLETNYNLNSEFLFRYLQSKNVSYFFEINANGVTRFGLGKSTIENLPIPLPTELEQIEIVHFLNQQTAIIGKLIRKKERLIEKIKEYRRSLISEAVTGKIDVRDWEPKN